MLRNQKIKNWHQAQNTKEIFSQNYEKTYFFSIIQKRKSLDKQTRQRKMKQCKICGTPLGKEPTNEELEKHWKKHHSWHWESNKEKTPEEALLKKR